MLRIAVILALSATLFAQEAEQVMRVYAVGGIAPEGTRDLVPWSEPRFGPVGPIPPRLERQEAWLGPEAGVSAGEIVDAVREMVTEAVRGAVAIGRPSGHLLVWATPAEHELIGQLLDTLHRQAGDPFGIEIRYASVRAGSLDEATRSALLKGTIDAAALAKLDALGAARGGTLVAPHGIWTSYRAVRQRRYMPEYDVEIAQAAAVPDPRTAPVSEGVQANVRPFLLQDGSVMLRIFASAGEIERMRRLRIGAVPGTRTPREPLSVDVGEVAQADFRGGIVSTQAIVPVGGTAVVVLGSAEGGADARWDVLFFTPRHAPRPAAAGTLTVLPLGALCAFDEERLVGFNEDEDSSQLVILARDEEVARFAVSEVAEQVKGGLKEGFLYHASWLHGGSMLVRGTASQARQVMATVGALEQGFLKPARVTVRFAGSASGAAYGMVGGPVLAESGATFAALRSVDLIGDYDVEVAQESRIADPVHRLAHGGAVARVKLFRTGPRQWRVGLELRLMALEPIVEMGHGSTEIGPIQDAPVQVRLVKTLLDVADGGEAILDLGANPYGEGRLFAIVQVNG